MDLEGELIFIGNLKNEMRRIRQQIDKEKNPAKKMAKKPSQNV